MVAMNIVSAFSARLVSRLMWLAAIIMFTFAMMHSFNMSDAVSQAEWVSERVQTLMGGEGTGQTATLRAAIQTAETAWAKSVKQRHDVIRSDYKTPEEMQL
jgi:hypothetical protein